MGIFRVMWPVRRFHRNPSPPTTRQPERSGRGTWNTATAKRARRATSGSPTCRAEQVEHKSTPESSFTCEPTIERTWPTARSHNRESEENLWISGGRFDTPSEVRHLAWRQLRPIAADQRFSNPDDTFVYAPTMRKVRRSATAWVDGMYTPSYRVGHSWGGGSIAAGSNGLAPTGAVSLSSALSHAATEHLPAGFNDLSIRPNAYRWRLLGMREVLAPINGVHSGYPDNPIRNFGTSGLALGSDRWEARYAVLIEGKARSREQGFDTLIAYVDYQTHLPLYLITRRIAEG